MAFEGSPAGVILAQSGTSVMLSRISCMALCYFTCLQQLVTSFDLQPRIANMLYKLVGFTSHVRVKPLGRILENSHYINLDE